ncbi:MFS family permease [Kitasatospora sp. MAA4]|uniref:MFS transporter n=1 Tax=Kitasatospora sp. MAA4 TaxID=3035093 RepID=UPI002476E42A|nr:MFS transporter [Kitasatospora sp. MAA4]MDH6136830.1 MFS family permease [Kitasatospora sp. MAA4]
MPASPLWVNRDYQLLWWSQTLSWTGSSAVFVALPLLVLHATGSPADAAVGMFAASTARSAGQVPAGLIADLCPRRTSMVLCEVVSVLACCGLLLLARGHGSLLAVALCVAAVGLAESVFAASAAVVLRVLVPVEQLPTAFGMRQVCSQISELVGYPLGGLAFALSPALPFAVDGVSYLVCLLAVSAIRVPLGGGRRRHAADRDTGPRGGLNSVRAGARGLTSGVEFLWRQRFLRWTSLASMAVNLVFSALLLIVITLVSHSGGSTQGGTGAGTILGCSAAAGVLASLLAPRLTRRMPPRTAVIATVWVIALATAGMALLPSPLGLGAMLSLCYLAGPIATICVAAVSLAATPEHLVGRVVTARALLAMAAEPLGAPLASVLLDRIGATGTLLVLAAGLAILGCLMSLLMPSLSLREAEASASLSS